MYSTPVLGQRGVEGRPAAVALELGVAAEQLAAAGPARVDALGRGVGVLPDVRPLGPALRAAPGTRPGSAPRATAPRSCETGRCGCRSSGISSRTVGGTTSRSAQQRAPGDRSRPARAVSRPSRPGPVSPCRGGSPAARPAGRGRSPGRGTPSWCARCRTRTPAASVRVGRGQGRADQDVVEHLAVALVDVAVALRRRQRARQVDHPAGGACCAPTRVSTVGLNSKSLRSPSTTTLADASASRSVSRKARTSVGLPDPLHLGGAHRLLPAAEQRVVAALGGEVVGDGEDGRAPEGELAHQRLARAGPRRAGRVDPAGGGRSGATLWPCVTTPVRVVAVPPGRSTKATPRSGAEQEHLADVAARLATVGAVGRVDPARVVRRSARGADGRRQHGHRPAGVHRAVVGGAAVVLDLLQRQDVRALQVGDDLACEPVELRLRVAGVEVLDVERGDGELVVALALGDLALQPAGGQLRRGWSAPACSC